MDNPAESTGEVCLSGPLTIRHAAGHRDALIAALSSHQKLRIDLPVDTDADISIVQLILATRVSARASGKQVDLKREPAGALKEILERGGFLAADDTQFWTTRTYSA